MKPNQIQFLSECQTESNDKVMDCGVALEIMNNDDIECAEVTNSGHVAEHSQIVEFQRYSIKYYILAFGRYISERCKQTMLNVMVECMAGILFTIVFWCSTNAHLKHIYDTKDNMFLNPYSLFLLVQYYVISSIGNRMMNFVVILPPMTGAILFTALTYKYIIQDFRQETLDYMYKSLFSYVLSEFTTLLVMIHGAFELDVWVLPRIGGVLSRLVLLPLVGDWIILIIVKIQIYSEIYNMNLLYVIPSYGFFWTLISHIVLLPYLSRLKRMGYGEEKNIITLVLTASIMVEIITSITDGFIIYIYVFQINYASIIEEFISLLPQYSKNVLIEIVFGIMYGLLMIYVPHPRHLNLCNFLGNERNEYHNTNINRQITIIRVFLLSIEGFLIMLYKWYTNFPMTCSLGCAFTCIIASTGWKWRDRKERHENPMISNIDDMLIQNQISAIVKFFEFILTLICPTVIGTIGLMFTKYAFIERMDAIVICLLIAYTYRIILTTISICGYGFNLKEIVFINISWIICSSATVCYSTIFYWINSTSNATLYRQRKFYEIATVVSIVLRAVLGHIILHWFGVRLLKKSN